MSEAYSIDLAAIAGETLTRYGFLIQPPVAALDQAQALNEPDFATLPFKDLSNLLWSSIDNDDSRDLDQIEYLAQDAEGTHLYIAIADLAAFIPIGSALDEAAKHNTTSLYTGIRTFPLFPERLSTNLTSLIEGGKRLAVVTEMVFDPAGAMRSFTLYRAIVQNRAQLTYHAVAAWLEASKTPAAASPVTQRMAAKIQAQPALQDQLRRQHELAGLLRTRRLEKGALTFESHETRPVQTADGSWELQSVVPDEATKLIEDFMIAANQAAVQFLESKKRSSLRRVVRTPKNWPRIMELAAARGTSLPGTPDAKALEDFLLAARKKDPDRYADLSLAVIKLLGRGEYVLTTPGETTSGHFALAVEGYTHSTAPNRRYPDVIIQRLLEAAIENRSEPYSTAQLEDLAKHCTLMEDAANKAERSVRKSMAAAILAPRIGQLFEGFITGASDKGVWVRILHPPVEGRVDQSQGQVDVGDHVQVKLVSTDPWHGYIDFAFIRRL